MLRLALILGPDGLRYRGQQNNESRYSDDESQGLGCHARDRQPTRKVQRSPLDIRECGPVTEGGRGRRLGAGQLVLPSGDLEGKRYGHGLLAVSPGRHRRIANRPARPRQEARAAFTCSTSHGTAQLACRTMPVSMMCWVVAPQCTWAPCSPHRSTRARMRGTSGCRESASPALSSSRSNRSAFASRMIHSAAAVGSRQLRPQRRPVRPQHRASLGPSPSCQTGGDLTATEYVSEQLAVKRGRHGQSIESKATIIFAAATKRVARRTRDTLAGGNRGQRTVDSHHRAADI